MQKVKNLHKQLYFLKMCNFLMDPAHTILNFAKILKFLQNFEFFDFKNLKKVFQVKKKSLATFLKNKKSKKFLTKIDLDEIRA